MKVGAVTSSGLTFGRYLLLERIAAGGMGEVYVALQTGIGRFSRPIAVKLLLPHLADDEKVVSMFLTEARVGAQMTHPNIAQVYDVGLEQDRYFIAMELVRGVSMSTLIAGLKGAEVQLSAELLAYIGRSLCEGLHLAHEQKSPDGKLLELVHRDVTPHNVLLSVEGAVKLTDFGIARVADADRLSRPGVLLGKLGYLAPEQLAGEAIDRRVDLFAAGASLYHLAALQKPFDTSTGSVIDPHRLPTVPLRVCRPDLPRPLIAAIEKAMAVAPSDRFATAKELRNALPVPGPDIADELGRLLRRVCGAALIDLERKTERATAAVEQAPTSTSAATAPRPRPRPRPRAVPSADPSADTALGPMPELRSRRPLYLVAALLVGGLGAAALALLGTGAPAAAIDAQAGRAAVAPSSAAPPKDPTASMPGAKEPAEKIPVPSPSDPAPTPPSTPTPSTGLGRLSVDAVPWATISLDGRELGETPLADLEVPLGPHTLIGTNPETGKRVRQKITVTSRQTLKVRLDLR